MFILVKFYVFLFFVGCVVKALLKVVNLKVDSMIALIVV